MSVELLLALGTAVCTIVGGFWAISKVAMRQFEKGLEERFKAVTAQLEQITRIGGDRLQKLEENYAKLDAEVRRMLIELPREYVRREDHIRFETVINAKLDAVAARQDVVLERLPRKD
jgi:hypothetical protein